MNDYESTHWITEENGQWFVADHFDTLVGPFDSFEAAEDELLLIEENIDYEAPYEDMQMEHSWELKMENAW